MSTSFPSSGGGAVASVNGATGVVVLNASDVGADAAGAAAAVAASSQPLDSDLTAIAALSPTPFGRALLALADAAAGRSAFGLGSAATSASSAFEPAGSVATEAARAMAAEALAALKANNLSDLASASSARANLGLGSAATQDSSAFDASGAAAAAQAASQPLDSDLTAIAALSTTTFGRSLLALADAAAGRTALGLGTAATSASSAFDAAGAAAAAQAASQPLDSDLTALAAIAPANDDLVQRKAGAWTNRTPAQVKTDLVLVKGDVGLGNVDNTADTAKPVSTAQQTALDLKAPLASPALTGTPTVPTAAVDTSTTQAASTAFVVAQAASATPVVDGTGAAGTSTRFARADHVHPTDTSRAPLASPTFTGTPAAPTPTAGDNSTKLATTAYVDAIKPKPLACFPESGSFFQPALVNSNSTIGSEGVMTALPFVLGVSRTLTQLDAKVSVAGGASSVLRLGLYADTGMYPGALIYDSGDITAAAAAVKSATGISASLAAGTVYWMVCVVRGVGGTVPTMVRAVTAGATLSSMFGDPSANSGFFFSNGQPISIGFSQSSVSGALPSTFTTTRTPIASAIQVVGKVS